MASTADLLEGFKKAHGDDVGSMGGTVLDVLRIPTDLFAFDLATGGGFPKGRLSIVLGPESSGKTNLSLKALASHQRLWPDEVNVLFDLEHTFDPAWAKKLGVDCDKLMVLEPSYAEQTIDMIDGLMETDDIGMIIVDSIAAMASVKEIDESVEKSIMGGIGSMMSRLAKKTTTRFVQAKHQGRQPTLLYINQVRTKIGVVFGDPETMPGGAAQKFQASLVVRLYGKSIMDPKIHKTLPIAKKTTAVIKKYKVPILSIGSEYEMVTYPHKGLEIGDTDDWSLVSEYLKTFGQIEKVKDGYMMLGAMYPTQKAMQEKFYTDREFSDDVRSALIKKLLEDTSLMQEMK